MRTLLPLPPAIRTLGDAETDRLRRQYGDIQSSLADCPTCRGRLTFRWYDDMLLPEEKRQVVDYECNCVDQFRLSRYLLNAGMDRVYGRYFWGDANRVDPKTYEFAMEYHENASAYLDNGTGIFLHGERGNGKSLIASLIFKQLLGLGATGYWTTFDQMLDRYSSTWRDVEERAWFDRTVRNARVLVVDDIGREAPNRQAMSTSAVDSIFRTRTQSGLATLVTTNLKEGDFQTRYTASVTSLVNEMCLHQHVIGEDWRTRLAAVHLADIRNGLSRPYTLGF